MRYNSVAYLGTTVYAMDDLHNQVPTVTWSKVYVNRYYDNINLQQQAAINDQKQLAQFEIMSADYSGQRLFKIDDVEYTVSLASVKGDRTVLTVEKDLSNE